MPGEDCWRLLQRLRELPIYYELYGLNDFYIETGYAPEVKNTLAHHLRRRPLQGPLDRVVDEPGLLKWVLGVHKDEPQDLLGQLEREFPQFAYAYAAFPACPEWRFVNVIARDACKERAFAWLLNHYQVKPEQVASFGDSHSDEVFLRSAGCGVAMGNASDDVKAVARFVTRNSWEDGVAYALARLI
jgi:hydroxymethylpyrimidine pyrophosphatase-like HAD family hydrolase